MNTIQMPRPQHSPRVSPSILSTLVLELRRFELHEAEVRGEYPWAERFVMGLPLAPWQRALKWDEKQSQRFITSAWTGVHLGLYLLTEAQMVQGSGVQYAYLANCVLDGQQRLHALEMYLTDALAVPNAAGALTLWSELNPFEQRWFERRIFERGTTPVTDEQSLRVLYDLMNFGGTAHEEHERALAQMRVSR